MKKFISGLLGILFVVLVVVGVFICTYVFNQPSRSGDSRELISGTWTDKDANITFEFSDEGDFTITHTDNKSVIAKGWFKIQEDGGSGKIQLLVNPSDRDTTVDIGLRKMCIRDRYRSRCKYRRCISGTSPDQVHKDHSQGVAL